MTQRNGFTLLEMLVALAVFSIAVLALVKMMGNSVFLTAELDDRLNSRIVAQNLAVDAMTAITAPAIGQTKGEIDNGGRTFQWTQNVSAIGDSEAQGGVVRVELSVARKGSAAVTTSFVRPMTRKIALENNRPNGDAGGGL